MKKHPSERLRRFPPLSHGCAMRAGGRRQRTQTKRRMHDLAALARRLLAWPRRFHGLRVARSTVGN